MNASRCLETWHVRHPPRTCMFSALQYQTKVHSPTQSLSSNYRSTEHGPYPASSRSPRITLEGSHEAIDLSIHYIAFACISAECYIQISSVYTKPSRPKPNIYRTRYDLTSKQCHAASLSPTIHRMKRDQTKHLRPSTCHPYSYTLPPEG